jgi:hypothetical protein
VIESRGAAANSVISMVLEVVHMAWSKLFGQLNSRELARKDRLTGKSRIFSNLVESQIFIIY